MWLNRERIARKQAAAVGLMISSAMNSESLPDVVKIADDDE